MNRSIIMSSEKPQIPNSLNEHWMPFTSNRDFKESPRLIVEAKGVYLKNHQGQTQIDASSGLFCNPLGHGREEIINAITNQLKKLDYAQDRYIISLQGKKKYSLFHLHHMEVILFHHQQSFLRH